MMKNKLKIPEGTGYITGALIAIVSLLVVGLFLENIPLGLAWFFAGYAIGFIIEGDNQKPFSAKQRRMVASSVISGGISLTISLFLLGLVYL